MKNMIKLGLLSLILVLGMTACGAAKVMNVQKQNVTQNATNDDIFKAIQKAGTTLGWIVLRENPQTALATLNIRTHQAVVMIKFNNQGYSIDYISSINLGHDPVEGTIHSNYNGWIQNLDSAIKIQLSSL